MAAFNIQEALTWKEKIEIVIDQVEFSSFLLFLFVLSLGGLQSQLILFCFLDGDNLICFHLHEFGIMTNQIFDDVDVQHQDSLVANGNKYISFEYKPGMDNGRNASSSDHESQ